MNKLDSIDIYEDISIKLLDYDEYIPILKKYNINSLNELFDLYNKLDLSEKGSLVLKRIIELLQYEYLNINNINLENYNKIINIEHLNRETLDNLLNIGLTMSESVCLIYYFNYYNKISNLKEMKIIDLLTTFIKDNLYHKKEIIPEELNNNLFKGIIIQNIKYKTYIILDCLNIDFNKEIALFMDLRNNMQMKANLDEQSELIRKQLEFNRLKKEKTMLKK